MNGLDFNQLVWRQPPMGYGWSYLPPEPVIWADLARFDAVWAKSSEYVGANGEGSNQTGRYENVGRFLRESIGRTQIRLPTVSIEHGEIIFTDGRHRVAWLRDHGLYCMPFEVGDDCAAEFEKLFGTNARVGRVVVDAK